MLQLIIPSPQIHKYGSHDHKNQFLKVIYSEHVSINSCNIIKTIIAVQYCVTCYILILYFF